MSRSRTYSLAEKLVMASAILVLGIGGYLWTQSNQNITYSTQSSQAATTKALTTTGHGEQLSPIPSTPFASEITTTALNGNTPVTITEVEDALDQRLIVFLSAIIQVLEGIKGDADVSDPDAQKVLTVSRKNNERTRNDLNELVADIETAGSLESTTLTGSTSLSAMQSNALLFTDNTGVLSSASNLSYLTGRLGIGTSSPTDTLSVDGPIYLSSVTPTDTANRLYNTGSNLYWNGSIIGSSTASIWSSGSGNAFYTLGNVGVGTTTPASTLTVDGTFYAATSTLRLVDTGGQVCNVEAYGAVGDNATINDTAIAAAIAACPVGGTVYFPMGEFRIASPIVLDRPVTLRGAFAPRWSYNSTHRSSIRADFASFAGDALVHVRDDTISGEASQNNGGRLEHISLDGGSASSSVNGIYFEGLVRDWKLTDVDISQVTGNGFESAVGTGAGNPRGFTIRGLSIYSADGHGFRATALNDTYIEDLLSVGNSLRGIYLSSLGETKINNSRAVFNGLTGLYIDGASNNGGVMFTDFSTDRNDRHGVRISLTGTTTVTFNGLLTRRDGANTSAGSETPYAGVAVIGTTTEQVAPVFINGLSQIIGLDDSNNPPLAPSAGVRAANAGYLKVEGQLWGVDNAYVDGGGNDHFIIEEESIIKVGSDGVTEAAPPTYNQKWIASTTKTSLTYDGQINIGSSTDSRLLNIVAPVGAGARFRDTTNDVIFDMRAEDFQGFFGTFSNHDLRFQTNNTSRLTIEADGSIGIGTTSPSAQFHTTGSLRFQTFGVGTLTSDANGNISVSSDERLKTNISDYASGLDAILDIQPITYNWASSSGFDTETLYAGFSAQNIKSVLPEAVGENNDQFLTLSDRPILAAAITAIQELWQMITGNTDRIDQLEIENSNLRERIEAIESELDVIPPAAPDPEPNIPSTPTTDGAPTSTPDTPPTPVEPTNIPDEDPQPSETPEIPETTDPEPITENDVPDEDPETEETEELDPEPPVE